jgi:UDP-N-acetylmuramoyl-L-alanyl-D-glutamate--2,6-diaminopimelate ligase
VAGRAVAETRPPFPWAKSFLSVGVTGTNGKTSTTRLVAHVFYAAGLHVVAETTLGFEFDCLPFAADKTLDGFYDACRRAARIGARRAVVEVTSQSLGKGFAKRWRLDIGVFTNLTRDHMDTHGTFEHYLASKAQLFVHLPPSGAAVLNAADPSSLLVARVTPPEVRRIYYAVRSRGDPAILPDLLARAVEIDEHGTHVELEPSPLAERLGGRFSIRLIGDVFAENALAAACATLAAGVSGDAVKKGLLACEAVAGRFQIVHTRPLVAVDYAHTPDALARTCDTARRLAKGGKTIVVFGAGGDRDHGKRAEMGKAVSERADIAIVTSDNPRSEDPAEIARAITAGFVAGKKPRIELDRRRAIAVAIDLAAEGDVVLVAGKGHEEGQAIRGETLPFSDVVVIREITGG